MGRIGDCGQKWAITTNWPRSWECRGPRARRRGGWDGSKQMRSPGPRRPPVTPRQTRTTVRVCGCCGGRVRRRKGGFGAEVAAMLPAAARLVWPGRPWRGRRAVRRPRRRHPTAGTRTGKLPPQEPHPWTIEPASLSQWRIPASPVSGAPAPSGCSVTTSNSRGGSAQRRRCHSDAHPTTWLSQRRRCRRTQATPQHHPPHSQRDRSATRRPDGPQARFLGTDCPAARFYLNDQVKTSDHRRI